MFSEPQCDLGHAIEASEHDAGAYVFRDENILGTRMLLMLTARNHGDALAAAQEARSEIDRLNCILSERDPQSELSRLNRSVVHSASEELFDVVREAERWRMITDGAFSGRLGTVIEAWQGGKPDRTRCVQLAAASSSAAVELDAVTRCVRKPKELKFALEGYAKGWIVDRAYEVARRSPGVDGALVDIGGDIRCGGTAPGSGGWPIGIPDPLARCDNAPLVAVTRIDGAIATSGSGPRDLSIDGNRHSRTLDPRTGWPVVHHVSATVVAKTASAADALATALLVLPAQRGLELAENLGAVARLTDAEGVVQVSRSADPALSQFTPTSKTVGEPAIDAVPAGETLDWHKDWQALATFTAPRRQLIRDPDFRSPYMTMWISDLENKPIRTLLMVGKRAEWQKDNFIWWSIHRERVEKLIATRSMSTSNAGVYNAFWDGVDDTGKPVPPGKYVLHVETSRERGKHTYRSLVLDFTTARRFAEELPSSEEGGGLRVSFDHY